MLRRRKQLMSLEPDNDLVKDIEENTNFLIVKRKNKQRKTRTQNDKYLFHTVEEGLIQGGIKGKNGQMSNIKIDLHNNTDINQTLPNQQMEIKANVISPKSCYKTVTDMNSFYQQKQISRPISRDLNSTVCGYTDAARRTMYSSAKNTRNDGRKGHRYSIKSELKQRIPPPFMEQESFQSKENIQQVQDKSYLSNMVQELIQSKKDHTFVLKTNDKVAQLDTNQINKSLVTVVQSDNNKQEFVVKTQLKKSLQQKQFQQNNQYPFEENNCEQFIFNKNELILQKDQNTTNNDPINFNYESIEQMGERSLEDFLYENSIHPYFYKPQRKDKDQQVSRFEFFLVKGNSYLYSEQYQKALNYFKEGLNNCKGANAFEFNIGLVYLGLKQYDSAKLIYKKLFDQLPNNGCIFMNLLYTLLLTGDFAEIIRFKDTNGMSRPRKTIDKPQVSLIQQEKEKLGEKRQKFYQILNERTKGLKDTDVIYSNIETKIQKNEFENIQSQQKSSKLLFTIAPKKSNSLDNIFKQLTEASQTYTVQVRDPIEDKYRDLMEDLKAFKQRINITEFFQQDKRKKNQNIEMRIRPWSSNKDNLSNSNIMNSTQMQRAKFFIKSVIGGKNKKEHINLISNIEALIEEHTTQQEENEKSYLQRRIEQEIDLIIKNLSISKTTAPIMREYLEMNQKDINEIDKDLVQRLIFQKIQKSMAEDERIISALGLSKEELEKRKQIAGDNVLSSHDGKKDEKDQIEKGTDQFESLMFNNFIIKTSTVPGTEIYDLFKDTLQLEQIKKILEKLSKTIVERFKAFQQEGINETHKPLAWDSPLMYRKQQKPKYQVSNSLVQQGNTINSENQAKSSLAFIFLQKINTMGFLNKIVQENMSKIKLRKQRGQNKGLIGVNLSTQVIKYLDQQFSRKNLLRAIDYQMIDNVLADLSFFSIFEKDVRMKLYKLCTLEKYIQPNMIIDENILRTEYMYVILSGNVSLIKNDHELGVNVPYSCIKSGECFGDLIIQSETVNPYDLLNKNVISANNEDECFLLKFERQQFIESLFKEMKETMYERIMLLKNAEFFEDLSPYALVILASNVQIKEYKLGDVIIKQGQIPTECYIILEGECKATYEKELKKSTQVSKYAKKCLQSDLPKPMHYSQINYTELAKRNIKEKQRDFASTAENQFSRVEIRTGFNNANVDNPYKYSFQNEVLKYDENDKMIEYRHHIVFDQLKQGKCVGYRSLLDKQIIRRHVIDEQEVYSDQLKITFETILNKTIKNSNQINGEKSITNESPNKVQEDNKALDENQVNLNLNLVNQTNDKVLEEKGEQSQNQLLQVNGYSPTSNYNTGQQQNSDEFLTRQLFLQRGKLYDALMNELMKAQVSIVADTAVVKVMVIKKDDKNFLNEALRNTIDRKLLQKKFIDYDRPMDNIQELMKIVEKEHEWKKYKQKLESDMLREVSMTKKLNKLLD